MPLLNPASIAAKDLDLVASPVQGFEMRSYSTVVESYHVATVEITGANAGVLTKEAVGNLKLAASARNLIVVADTPIEPGAVNPVITLACKDNTGTPVTMNGVGTFAVPGYVNDQSKSYPKSIGFDLEPATPGKLFTEVTSLGSVTADAVHVGVRFLIFAVPALSDFYRTGCTNERGLTLKDPESHPIACANNLNAFTGLGDIPVGTFAVNSKMLNGMDGMMRYRGRFCTGLIRCFRRDRVEDMRILAIRWFPSVKPTIPGGKDEMILDTQGNYEHLAIGYALAANP